ncbi:SMI1/KNR4 family protein [Streptomyces endophyticus]|uniref:SMI1/KNR4 family protein n=1 Tax=Streptomyces endophyticus TaxID=714166 RepID=A0ABU6FB14_9ACTN|nr:SMI1/KNR4 family protein [Streptomyces endophyticus]MEB8341225.1 SMI1/KNR4 family protein [Streptomyces endophyticus]
MDNGREPIDEKTLRGLMEAQRIAAEQRQVAAAWGRIEAWLGEHARGSLAALRPGTYDELPWAAFMLEEMALLPLDRVAELYEFHMSVHRHSGIDEDEEGAVPYWRASWIPLCAGSHYERYPLLYVDLETGRVCFCSRYGERSPRYESVTDYLEEMADRLESPHLLDGPRPGTMDLRALVWGHSAPEPGTDTHDGAADPA